MKKLLPLTALCLVAGCAQTGALSQADRNQFVTEFYALVDNVTPVTFESHVDEAMAVGAVGGVLENIDEDREAMIGGALVGAMFTGFLTALFEPSTQGYEYQLHAIDGDMVTVVVDGEPALIGDCVKVRVSGEVRIVRQPQAFCELHEKGAATGPFEFDELCLYKAARSASALSVASQGNSSRPKCP